MKIYRTLPKCLFAGAFALLLVTHLGAQTTQVQTNTLTSGWNLLAFQVIPSDPNPAAVFATLPNPNDFVAAWTFDNSTRQWTRYARPGTAESTNNAIVPMAPIVVGRAYWVYMSNPATWLLTGTPPAQVPAVQFTPGWNLVGIPIRGHHSYGVPDSCPSTFCEHNDEFSWGT